jgi:hypothetical protein
MTLDHVEPPSSVQVNLLDVLGAYGEMSTNVTG